LLSTNAVATSFQKSGPCSPVRHSSYLKVKVCRVILDMHRAQKLHVMSLVMWTCQNDLGLNLCVVPLTSHMVTISENGFVRSCKERSALPLTLEI